MKSYLKVRILFQAVVSIVVLSMVQVAQAVMVPPGGAALLSGTTSASNPDLGGLVLKDDLIPFQINDSSGNILLEGVVQDRVVRSTNTGKLIFAPRLRDLKSPNGTSWISSLRLEGYGGVTTDIDFRTDGLGDVGPDEVTRSAGSGDELFFRYDPNIIEPPKEGLFLSVFTDVPAFCTNGKITVFAQNDFGASVFSTTLSNTASPDPDESCNTIEPPTFESISVQGEVKSGAPQEPEETYMMFHAKFKLNGEQIADVCDDPKECDPPDVTINTTIYSILWPFETLRNAFPILAQNLHLKAAGRCFKVSEQGYVFEMQPDDPQKCVTALLQATTNSKFELLDGLEVQVQDMKELLQSMKMQMFFTEGGKDGRFEGEAKFMNPPFPYPVAGLGGVPGGPSSGTELCFGSQCGSAPFGSIGFVGCAGEEICEPIEPDPESCTATVDPNLDIHVPEATYRTLGGTSNIWFNLEFKGVDPDDDFIWRLKDFGENK